MSVELKGRDDKFCIDIAGWYFILELGLRFGWEPQGARRQRRRGFAGVSQVDGRHQDWEFGPHDGKFAWYNSYILGSGRKVSRKDARGLADALQEALSDVPDHDALCHKARAYPMPAAMARVLHDMRDDNMPGPDQYVRGVEWFSGRRKWVLRDFIIFCHMGGFSIWM